PGYSTVRPRSSRLERPHLPQTRLPTPSPPVSAAPRAPSSDRVRRGHGPPVHPSPSIAWQPFARVRDPDHGEHRYRSIPVPLRPAASQALSSRDPDPLVQYPLVS